MAYRFGTIGGLAIFRWESPILLSDVQPAIQACLKARALHRGSMAGIGIFPLPFEVPAPDVLTAFQAHLEVVCAQFASVHLVLEGPLRETLPMQQALSETYDVVRKGELYLHTNFDEALLLIEHPGHALPAPVPEIYARTVDRGLLRDEEGELHPFRPDVTRTGSA